MCLLPLLCWLLLSGGCFSKVINSLHFHRRSVVLILLPWRCRPVAQTDRSLCSQAALVSQDILCLDWSILVIFLCCFSFLQPVTSTSFWNNDTCVWLSSLVKQIELQMKFSVCCWYCVTGTKHFSAMPAWEMVFCQFYMLADGGVHMEGQKHWLLHGKFLNLPEDPS